MTIAEACSSLFSWFSENEHFEMSKNYKELLIITDDEQREKSTISLALKRLEEINIISKLNIKPSREMWVLEKGLDNYEQKIEISGLAAGNIASIINKTCDVIGDYQDLCNPLSINEKDINNLIFICQKLYEHSSEKKDA